MANPIVASGLLADRLVTTGGGLAAARARASFQQPFSRPQPLVTICIATSNRSALLVDRCLASIRRQTYANLQIVVVGDHCTDDTERRVAGLRDDRIEFANLPSRGPYPRAGRARWLVAGTHAMNRALGLAEGDFVCHLDDDDMAVATRIERLVEVAQRRRAEFLWHRFSWEVGDGHWKTLGRNRIQLGHVTSGSIFYHRYFSSIPWDVHAFRAGEPGDWNRVKRIQALGPVAAYVPNVLTLHYAERTQLAFVPQPGEVFLD